MVNAVSTGVAASVTSTINALLADLFGVMAISVTNPSAKSKPYFSTATPSSSVNTTCVSLSPTVAVAIALKALISPFEFTTETFVVSIVCTASL